MSSTCLLYKVRRPAFEPIGDKACSRTLSSSPCPSRRPCKNVKRMLTGFCQLQTLYSSWSLTYLELGCSLSFHRHVVHMECAIYYLCVLSTVLCTELRSHHLRTASYLSFYIMLSATWLQSILNGNVNGLLMTSDLFALHDIAGVPSERESTDESNFGFECCFVPLVWELVFNNRCRQVSCFLLDT